MVTSLYLANDLGLLGYAMYEIVDDSSMRNTEEDIVLDFLAPSSPFFLFLNFQPISYFILIPLFNTLKRDGLLIYNILDDSFKMK